MINTSTCKALLSLCLWGFFLSLPLAAQSTFPSGAKILCLGDSRVEGNRPVFESYRYEFWKDLVDCNWDFDLVGTRSDGASYPDYEGLAFDKDHEGTSGATSGFILSGLPSNLAQVGTVDIVLLGIGGNDALGGASVSDVITNINSIIDLLQANNPNVVVLLEQIAPGRSDIMSAALTAMFNDFNNQILTVASNQTDGSSQVIAVDMASGWQDSYMADEVHYNDTGAEIVAERYSDALKTLYSCTTTSTASIRDGYGVKVYPNPSTDRVTIEAGETLDVGLFSCEGREISKATISGGQGQIDIRDLPNGVYFLKISGRESGESGMQRIVRQ